jgi:hypothetical protein
MRDFCAGSQQTAHRSGAAVEGRKHDRSLTPEPVDHLDLVNAMYRWTEAWRTTCSNQFGLSDHATAGILTSVHAKNLIVHHDAQRQKVEHVREVLPYDRRAVLAGTFGVESICLREMIAT